MKNNRTFLEKLLDGAEVEWKPLKKVCNFISTGKLNANAMDENGIYPFFTCNEKPYKINNYAFDMEAILISGNGSQVGHLNYFKGKFNAYQRTYVIGEFDNNTLVMYLYHYLNFKLRDYITINSKKGSVPYITLPMLEKFEIPIPPLSVQTEIVKILDALTALTSELTSELILRRKQYEYYREKLLSFDSLEQLNSGGGGKKKLIDVAYFQNGKGHEKNIDENGSFIVINSKFISTNGTIKKYCNDQLVPLFKEDILIVMSDLPNGKALAKTFFVTEDNKYTLNQRIGRITVKKGGELLPSFVNHFLNRNKQLTKYDNGTDQTNLRKDQILDVVIPIPPLKEQHRIVSILDKFETLTNSITEGLPLAIEQSKKRYEYYRELLLNFS